MPILLPLLELRRKWWFWLIAVIFMGWIGLKGWDYYKLLSGQTPMFDVAIKLKVGDELVEINRTVPCLKVHHGEALLYLFDSSRWSMWPFYYAPRDLSTGAELSDGRGVVVALPLACKLAWKARVKGESGNVLPTDFLPVIALLDDADDPQVAKFILSRSYYRRPDKEVDLLEYSVTPSKKFTFPSFPDGFNWMQGGDLSNEVHFATQYLVGMPATEFWRGYLDRMPGDDITKPVSIYDLPKFNFPLELRKKYEKEPLHRIGHIYTNLGWTISSESAPDAEYLSADYAIPVVRTSSGDTYDPNQKGYLVYYRQSTGKDPTLSVELKTDAKDDVKEIRRNDYNLVRDGTHISVTLEAIRHGGRYGQREVVQIPIFYDPESKLVYWVKSSVWNFPDLR